MRAVRRHREQLVAAARRLARQPIPSVATVLVLGLTAAVATLTAAVVRAYLVRPLPYPASERLVVVQYPREGGPLLRDLEAVDWRGTREVAELTVSTEVDAFTVLGADSAFSVEGQWMTAEVFDAFGVTPAAGRFFTAEEAARGERLAVIGARVWRDQFQGRQDTIGRVITARATLRQGRAETFTIVGVLPDSWWHLDDRTALILPLAEARPPSVLRLRQGITATEAAARLTAMVRSQTGTVAPGWAIGVDSAQAAHVAGIRPTLVATTWAVVLIGTLALATTAFLQMVQGLARQRELAVRSVLGGTRGALWSEVLVEGLLVGGGAAVLAWVVASLAIRLGLPALEVYFGRAIPGGAATLGSDAWLLAASAGATVVAGVALSAVLLATAWAPSIAAALAGHPTFTDTPSRAAARQFIGGVQVAVAFCLLVLAALTVRTAWHLAGIDLGFEPAGILTANVTLHEGSYRTVSERRQFFATLLRRIESLPDVSHAGLTGWLPFRIGPGAWVEREGIERGAATRASLQPVTPGYFDALRIRLIEGRLLAETDRAGSERVVVISRDLARTVWPDRSALGQRVRVRFTSADTGRPGFGPFTVVGIVGDTRQSVMQPTPPQLYTAFLQEPLATNAFLYVRTTRAPGELVPALARVVREADPSIPLSAATPLDQIVEAAGLRPRLLARVLAGFAALGVTTAVIGLYAVSHWMSRRREREAALRVALGAGRGRVTALFARQGLVAMGGGLAAGWMAAAPLAAMVATELRGVSHADLGTRLAVAAALVSLFGWSLWQPAWRATTSNLAALLRAE